jgi:hypothetical protein
MQRLHKLQKRRVEGWQVRRRLQQQSSMSSFPLDQRQEHLPIRICPIVISQIIEVDDQSDLLEVEHPSYRISVVVVRPRLT